MKLMLDTMVVRDSNTLTAEIDDEVVMMSAEQGKYFGLSAVGVDIWNMAERSVSVREIVRVLCDKYDVDFEKCEGDTLAFLSDMVSAGLMRIVD